MSTTFHVVAGIAEFDDTNQLQVDLHGEEILLCQFDGEYYAISYYCSHEQLTLHGGDITQGCITCPYHGAEFSLKTGEVLAPPAWEGIKTYPVKWDDLTISVGIEEPA